MLPVPPRCGKRKTALGPQPLSVRLLQTRHMAIHVSPHVSALHANSKYLPNHIFDDFRDIGSGYTFTEPCALHEMSGNRPHLEVVGTHEYIGNSFSHDAHNPLVEIGWRCASKGVRHFSLNEPVDTANLVFLGKRTNVVLEWIWNPSSLYPGANVCQRNRHIEFILLTTHTKLAHGQPNVHPQCQ